MNDARIIINVSDNDYAHHNGASGNWIVPAKKANEEFGMLLVYNARELQDVGNNIKTVHWPSSTSVALDIMGRNSDASAHTLGTVAGVEKWGIYLCEANPDIPRELLLAIDEEIVYLNKHRAKHRQERDDETKMMLQVNLDPPEVKEMKAKLSAAVSSLREKFFRESRRLVQKHEIAKAKECLQTEDQRLVSEGDLLWAGNEAAKRNLNELHKAACRRLGQERPWCYIPKQLVDCPGCGAKIREDILTCPQCAGWLDEGIEELRAMKPKDRAIKMYPERYAEAAPAKKA
jgi:hypothetical protein